MDVNGSVSVPGLSPASTRAAVEGALESLFDTAQSDPIVLSPVFALALIASMDVAPYKRVDSKLVSSTTIFLVSAIMALEIVEPVPVNLPRDSDVATLGEWGRSLSSQEARLEEWLQQYFTERPTGILLRLAGAEAKSYGGLRLGPGLARYFRASPTGATLELIPALIALGEDEDAGLNLQTRSRARRGIWTRLRGVFDDEDGAVSPKSAAAETISTAPDAGPAPKTFASSGESLSMQREATEGEVGLGFSDYAVALATVLRSATGEFTFGLFGRWGSGKTTLTKLLKPLLDDPTKFAEEVPSANGSYAAFRYSVVTHNAWKYRAPPEAWIYVYKSLADAAANNRGWLDRLTLASRKTFHRKGPWPATLALLVLALVLAPFAIKLHLVGLIVSLIGFSTVLHLSSMGASAARRVRELLTDYFAVTSHETKLGMLATIGDDVKSLLAAWTKPLPGDRSDPVAMAPTLRPFVLPCLVLAVTAGVWLGLMGGLAGLSALWWLSPLPTLPQALEKLLTPYLAIRASIGDWILSLGWLGLSFALLALPWLWPGEKRPNRVLLIVDDLDRCSPNEMLDVIESLKLLVDDPEINRRLQILMLVDETVLNHAISVRYASMIKDRAARYAGIDGETQQYRRARDEIVVEQNEKLFACGLRLSALTDTDVVSIVASLANPTVKQRRSDDEAAARLATDGKENETLMQATAADTNSEEVAAGNSPPHDPPFSEQGGQSAASTAFQQNEQSRTVELPIAGTGTSSEDRFTEAEVVELEARLPLYFRSIGRAPSPRAIKVLLFKVQLAKFLLRRRQTGNKVDSSSIGLILDSFAANISTREKLDPESVQNLIARQVL